MNIQRKRIFRRSLYVAAAAIITLMPAACNYMHRVYLRGEVVDVSGQMLPGVVVHVAGTEFEALTNARGQYSLGASTGRMHLEFSKTGYTSARIEVNADTIGVMETPQVALWPLPIGEGVYLFQNYRYQQAGHPRPNRYKVKDLGTAFGTPVNPELVIPWTDPESTPKANPPFMIGHKIPAYDARMHKLRQVSAALIHAANRETATAKDDSEAQYTEEIWVAEKSVPVRSLPLDEPGRLLVELRAAAPLEPGVYAIHWGALEGYSSIEPRIFLFALEAPPEAPEEGEGEAEGEKEGESPKRP